MSFLAGVAGGGEREQFAVEREPGAHHGDGLDGLERGARVEGDLDVTELEVDLAVRAEHDDGAVVDALRHPAADEVGDGGVEGFADRGGVGEGTAVHHCLATGE